MGTPHKHADVIVAWSLGYKVEGQRPLTGEWIEAPDINTMAVDKNWFEPSPFHPDYDWWEWRVRSAPEFHGVPGEKLIF